GALELALEVEVVRDLVRLVGRRKLAPAPTRPAQADVARDRREPDLGRLGIAQLVRAPPRLEQRLLREILGRVAVADDLRAQPPEPPPPRVVPEPLCRRLPHVRVQSRLGRETQRRFPAG